jgi:hypothetical protein
MGAEISTFSTHCTTCGDMLTAMLKYISISEARDKVPANNVRFMSHPFEREAETLALGINPTANRNEPNERTIDHGWVGPVMCRYVAVEGSLLCVAVFGDFHCVSN